MKKNFLLQLIIAIIVSFIVCYTGGFFASATLNIALWETDTRNLIGVAFMLLCVVSFSALLSTHKDTK